MHADPARTRSYAQLCGIATALDVVGDRWSLLIVRDLLLGPLRFGDLAVGLPHIGTNTLAARLKHLESADVVRRGPGPLPEGGMVYELTEYGRELEPILLALGRWGTRSMGRLPTQVTSRSRWMIAALLAFQDSGARVAEPLRCELRLTDGPFTLVADGDGVSAAAGAPANADLILTCVDEDLHMLLTGQLPVGQALADGRVTLDGDAATLELLLGLFAFPALEPAPSG
ncbi:MAG TPA: winged helix-turn-helix transcriptional regulator [Solirubrobacteraceae bacterium]